VRVGYGRPSTDCALGYCDQDATAVAGNCITGDDKGPLQPSISWGRLKHFSFADALTFTTAVNAGVHPTLISNKLTERLRPTDAKADVTADQNDEHKPVFGMAAIPIATDSARRSSRSVRNVNLTGSNNAIFWSRRIFKWMLR
jgi:hypothetical protein